MKKQKKSSGRFDPNGNYTGKYFGSDGEIEKAEKPEQDVDDL